MHPVFHARSLTPFDEGLDLEVRAAQALPDPIQPETGQEMWVVQELSERTKIGSKHYYFVTTLDAIILCLKVNGS